uniref:Uncharacterized protein n=1 Tax=Lotus japonicus TaxID=34305 RepID=I3SAT0_LOTJA|nr:unknown [Lotus japonicus]
MRPCLLHRQENKCVIPFDREACSVTLTCKIISFLATKFSATGRMRAKPSYQKIKILGEYKKIGNSMSKLAKNIIQPSLIIQATSAILSLFMGSLFAGFSKFLKTN